MSGFGQLEYPLHDPYTTTTQTNYASSVVVDEETNLIHPYETGGKAYMVSSGYPSNFAGLGVRVTSAEGDINAIRSDFNDDLPNISYSTGVPQDLHLVVEGVETDTEDAEIEYTQKSSVGGGLSKSEAKEGAPDKDNPDHTEEQGGPAVNNPKSDDS